MTHAPVRPASAEVSRRGFLQLSGAGLFAAVALSACGDSGAGSATTTTTTRGEFARDVLLLRTATSIELLHTEIYTKVMESKLLTGAAADAGKQLLTNHKEQAELLQTETTKLGGERYEQPNPALARLLEPRLGSLKDEAGILALALETERAAAATYQSYVGEFSDDNRSLNQVVMSVGGAAARAAALLARVAGQTAVSAPFQATTGAVAAGTGI